MRMNTLPKKPTDFSLDKSLLLETRALGIKLSQATDSGLKSAIIDAKSEQWKIENADALASSNEWVDANGLPLDHYMQF